MKAKYDVEVAKLDASKSEVVSRIEGAEAKLKLADAEQALRQAEAAVEVRHRGRLERPFEDKKNASRKAEFDAQRAETRIGCHDVEGAVGRNHQSSLRLAQRRRSPLQSRRARMAGHAAR